MKERLPVDMENLELPDDDFWEKDELPRTSYGFANILYILSLLITIGSVLTVVFLGNR